MQLKRHFVVLPSFLRCLRPQYTAKKRWDVGHLRLINPQLSGKPNWISPSGGGRLTVKCCLSVFLNRSESVKTSSEVQTGVRTLARLSAMLTLQQVASTSANGRLPCFLSQSKHCRQKHSSRHQVWRHDSLPLEPTTTMCQSGHVGRPSNLSPAGTEATENACFKGLAGQQPPRKLTVPGLPTVDSLWREYK